MDPLDLWTLPWTATLELWRRALAPEETPPPDPEWITPHRVALRFGALRLVDFSGPGAAGVAAVVVAPHALHDSALVDLAPGHSLVAALRMGGAARLFLVDWASATPATRLDTIDTQLAALNVALDDIGAPVDLIGLCQGGWLSLAFAARFPHKVRRLALIGAPVDLDAAPSKLSAAARNVSAAAVEELIRAGGGRVRGAQIAALWPREFDEARDICAVLQIEDPPQTQEERRAVDTFAKWDRRRLDLPGPYYAQVFAWLYHENRLARGAFAALGRKLDLTRLRAPLYLLAGAADQIAPPGQVFAAEKLTGARDVVKALAPCGHLSLFLGRRALAQEWPKIAAWLRR